MPRVNADAADAPQLSAESWLEYSLAYASAGWRVFPLQPRSKEPFPDSDGLTAATDDHDTIRMWGAAIDGNDEIPNIGLVPPPGRCVVDVDPRHDGVAPDDMPVTAVQYSGGPDGGTHYILDVPVDVRLRGKLAQGVDIRSSRAYILAEPSVHPSGGVYRWKRSSDGEVAEILAAPAPLLARMVRPPRTARAVVADGDVDPLVGNLTDDAKEQLSDALAAALIDGQKHATVKAFGGWLKQQRVQPQDAADVVREALELHGGAEDVEAGVDTALWAYEDGADYVFGWEQLREVVEPDALTAIESLAPKAVAEARATSALARSKYFGHVVENAADTTTHALPDDVDPIWEGTGAVRLVDFNTPPEPLVLLAEGLPFAAGQINALVGLPNVGKTPMLMTLAVAVANGTRWLDYACEEKRVLVLAYEDAEATKVLLQRAANALNLSTDNITVLEMEPGSLTKSAAIVRTAIAASGAGACFIETYDSAIEGLDQNAKEYADPIKKIAVPGCATVITLHAKKAVSGFAPRLGDIAGTGSLGASIKGAIGVHRVDEDDEFTFELTAARSRAKRFSPFRVRFVDVAGEGKVDWGLKLEMMQMPQREAGESSRPPSKTKAERLVDYRRGTDVALKALCRDAKRFGDAQGLPEIRQLLGVDAGSEQEEALLASLDAAVSEGPPLLVKYRGARGANYWRPTTRAEREEDLAVRTANRPAIKGRDGA